MKRPLLALTACYILFGAGVGLGFMSAVLIGATKEPEVVVKERWMLRSTTTTTYNYMPPDDLSHLANEGPCYTIGTIQSGFCPTTTTVLTVPSPPTVLPTSPPTTRLPDPTTTTVTTQPVTTTTETTVPETTTTTDTVPVPVT